MRKRQTEPNKRQRPALKCSLVTTISQDRQWRQQLLRLNLMQSEYRLNISKCVTHVQYISTKACNQNIKACNQNLTLNPFWWWFAYFINANESVEAESPSERGDFWPRHTDFVHVYCRSGAGNPLALSYEPWDKSVTDLTRSSRSNNDPHKHSTACAPISGLMFRSNDISTAAL